MDIIEQFYNKYPYPDFDYIIKSGNHDKHMKMPIRPTAEYNNKDICIAGCGTYQAFDISRNNPTSRVTAIDVSESTIKITSQLCKDIKNLDLIHGHFENLDGSYDFIVCTGVLHHVENRLLFLNHAYDILRKDGRFQGMVYFKEGRGKIRELSEFFLYHNYSVNDVRTYFDSNPEGQEGHEIMTDIEIADCWLNPRFVEYDVDSLLLEISNTKWNDCKFIYNIDPNKRCLFFELYKD